MTLYQLLVTKRSGGERSREGIQDLLPLSGIPPSHIFSEIRDYLAGRHVGATRDAALLDQLLLCLFAKLYLVQHGAPKLPSKPSLRTAYDHALRRIQQILGKSSLPERRLSFGAETLFFVDEKLSMLDLAGNSSDLVGDAYQCFLGAEVRGQEGQFFTPPAAINTLVALIAPQPNERIIDPACGAGGFLVAVALSLRRQQMEASAIARSVFGVEKDDYLARLARMRLSLMFLRAAEIETGDSLSWLPASSTASSFMKRYGEDAFDVVLTNPPFGTRIIAASDAVRQTFALAHRWVMDGTGRLRSTTELSPSTPPQVLFLERCLALVRPGGRIGVVVPESLISGKGYRHVVQHIRDRARVTAVIGMPEELFKTSGKGGTHTKTALLVLSKFETADRRSRQHPIFMAEAEWCGHDSRGRTIPRDDTPAIVSNYESWRRGRGATSSPLGFGVPVADLKDGVLAPRAYDPAISSMLAELKETHHLLRFGDLVKDGFVSFSTGDEVGKLAYGDDGVPFVRTSDIANWELKIDPKHTVSREIFESLRRKQDIQAGDILMVKDGTYLIGTCAMVTKYDTEILYQSHLYKIRVHPHPVLDSYILLAALTSSLVRRQIRAEVQTQDIIDSLGSRISNLVLPVPRDEERRREISESVERIVTDRAAARELARRVAERILSQSID